MIKDSRSDK